MQAHQELQLTRAMTQINIKPTMCRIVEYNHPGSTDGKYPPIQSPAIVQRVYNTGVDSDDLELESREVCDLFVMSNTGGIFFAKGIPHGEPFTPSTWSWPKKV